MVGVDLVGDHRVLRRLAQVALLAELERRCGAVAQVRDPGGVESHLVRVRVRVRARASVRVRVRVPRFCLRSSYCSCCAYCAAVCAAGGGGGAVCAPCARCCEAAAKKRSWLGLGLGLGFGLGLGLGLGFGLR